MRQKSTIICWTALELMEENECWCWAKWLTSASFNTDLWFSQLGLDLALAAVFRNARSRELYSSLCFCDTMGKKKSGDRTVLYRIKFSIKDTDHWAVVEVTVRFFNSSWDSRGTLNIKCWLEWLPYVSLGSVHEKLFLGCREVKLFLVIVNHP